MNWLVLSAVLIILLFGFVVFRGSPYVPSQKKYVRQAFHELYNLGPNDLLVDIGSGDGVVLREAAKTGAGAVGYEINPILVGISRVLCRKNKKISIFFADFWLSKIPKNTTVIYVFSATRDMKKLMEKFQNEADRIGNPINVISYGSEFDSVEAIKNVGAYHLYLIRPLQPDKAQV
jgi:hypothetical protein